MWAAKLNWYGDRVGKYHWFEPECGEPGTLYRAECSVGVRIYNFDYDDSKRTQPRHADRCRRCVAALTRREG